MGFENIYNHKAIVKESANARVNLIGEHTDYTGGYVMPTLLGFKNTIESVSYTHLRAHET